MFVVAKIVPKDVHTHIVQQKKHFENLLKFKLENGLSTLSSRHGFDRFSFLERTTSPPMEFIETTMIRKEIGSAKWEQFHDCKVEVYPEPPVYRRRNSRKPQWMR